MKKYVKVLAPAMAAALTLPLFAACGKDGEAKAETYVGIDVNPSLSLVLDGDGKVLSVLADNEDAQVLLYGEDLTGMTAEEAAEKIASLSVELGYLNDENKGVSITVEGEAGEVESAFRAAFEGAADGISFSSGGTFSQNRKLAAVNAEYGLDLTIGEFRLIAEAKAADGSLTWEAAAEMDTSELLALIADAADAIEPYATAAYSAAKQAALYAYETAKGQLVDALWLVPYSTTYLPEVLTGQKVNYGAIYNAYTGAVRVLDAGLTAAEKAEETAEKVPVSDATLDAIATALGMSDEQKADFVAQVEADGKTVAALDDYLDVYFKNMTEDARQAIKDKIAEVTAAVQAEADKIDESIAQEYKDALKKLCSDLTALIPDSIKNTANTYLSEFSALAESIGKAAEGKEPKAAVYAVRDAIDGRSDEVMNAMRSDLTEEDIQKVENSIAAVTDALSAAEEKCKAAIAEAETQAREYLAALRAARENAE